MTLVLPKTDVYEFDAGGHLVRLEDETDDEYTLRTAGVLYDEGLSTNHPDVVAVQFMDPPVIESINPMTLPIGSDSVDLVIVGTGFTDKTVINFAGQEEPTTLNQDGTLTTGLTPSLWHVPVTVQCFVVNEGLASDPVDFVFTDAVPPATE